MKPVKTSPFGERLVQAFGGAPLSAIAEKIGVRNSAVTNYMKGRIPPPAMLVKISDYTNCSIHWLVTGELPRNLGKDGVIELFDTRTQRDIFEIGDRLGWARFRGAFGLIESLVAEGIAAARRSTDLTPKQEREGVFTEEQVKEIRAIVQEELILEAAADSLSEEPTRARQNRKTPLISAKPESLRARKKKEN